MIRSVKLSVKFCNKSKQEKITSFLGKYRLAVCFFIDVLWESDQHKYVDLDTIKRCNIDISARAKQCAGKQALSIINGTFKKHKQRIYIREQLKIRVKNTDRLDKLIQKAPSKPTFEDIGSLGAELDSRFVKFLDTTNSFDMWASLYLGGKKVLLPLRKTSVYNKWAEQGVLKTGCRLLNNKIIVYFEVDKPVNKSSESIGIDIGLNSIFSTSEGNQVIQCPHGHTLNSICKKLANKKRGSKGFKRSTQHRNSFICWSVKQLNLQNNKLIVVENIKNMRLGKNTGRFLSHFTYAEIFNKLELLCESLNVSVTYVNPAYTSQKCSMCGEIKAKNRVGELFRCVYCNFTENADINAAKNILTSL